MMLGLTVTACINDFETDGITTPEPIAKDGEMAVNIHLSIPTISPATRSMVPGAERMVSDMKMICFDANGYYLGVREATVVSTYKDDASNNFVTSPDKGTIVGTVPAATCRVHFIANRAGLDLSNVAIGTAENIVMRSEAMSTLYNETDEISYWGFHREENVALMQQWLAGEKEGDNTVYLLRDRAQVRIRDVSDGEQINLDKIHKVEWTISHGRDRGYLAPYNPADVRHPFDNYYKVESEIMIANSVISEYAASGRYDATETDIAQNGSLIVGGDNTLKPIFLFEDLNDDPNLREVDADVVKLILKVQYLYDENGDKLYDDNGEHIPGKAEGKIRYHTVLLMNQEYEMFHVTRNHTYTLTITGLPRSLGANSFAEALVNTNYSNNQLTNIEEEATDVTDGTHSLSIQTVSGTSVVYQQAETVDIPFRYLTNSAGDPNVQFSAVWKTNEEVAETNIPVVYDSSTGEGVIKVTLKDVGETLKYGKLLFTDKTFGLQRYVNVYTISEYKFRNTPTLVSAGTRQVGTATRNVYKLTLQLPSGTNRYPKGLYPITVKFATQTLNAFSDTSATAAHGSYGVTMETTAVDGIENGTASDNNYPWNYQARDWGYWYSYIVLTQEDMTTDSDGNDEITLYFDDIRTIAHPNSTFNSIGLYYQIDYFGGMKSAFLNVN